LSHFVSQVTHKSTHSQWRTGFLLKHIYGISLGYVENLLEVLSCECVSIVDEESAISINNMLAVSGMSAPCVHFLFYIVQTA